MRTRCAAEFEEAIGACLQSITDASVKVGVQGWDSNRWRIDEVLAVLEAYAAFAEVVWETTGFRVGPTDVWGGGQVSQAPRFLGEEPYRNLERMRQVAPNLRFKCIYRGRQGFGFVPCSAELQTAAIHEAAECGMHVFRMFDPLCDPRNLLPSLEAVKSYRATQLLNGTDERSLVSAEGLVFYVRPEENIQTVWDENRLIEYAITLAQMGFHELSLADYAQQIPDPKTAYAVISTLRAALNTAGFSGLDLNFFAHGEQCFVNKAAIDGGAATVDSAIGLLSGGLSNTDLFPLLRAMMLDKGYDIENKVYADHPVLASLRTVETTIARHAAHHIPYRIRANTVEVDIVSRSRLGFNAVSALHSAIKKNWDTLIAPIVKTDSSVEDAQNAYAYAVVEEGHRLWIRGGQFHQVTPFGYINSFQAESSLRSRLSGHALPLGQFRKEFIDVLKGRYGRNIGVEDGKCDVELVKSFHLYEALEIIRSALFVPPGQQSPITSHLSPAFPSPGAVVSSDAVVTFLTAIRVDQYFAQQSSKGDALSGFLSLRSCENLESTLGKVDMAVFRAAIGEMHLNESLQSKIDFALSSDPYPLPSGELEEAKRILDELRLGQNNKFALTNYSPADDSYTRRALLSIALYKTDAPDPFGIGKNLLRHIASDRKVLFGDIESDSRPFDKLFSDQIVALAEIHAKRSILIQKMKCFRSSSPLSLAYKTGQEDLRMKKKAIASRLYATLQSLGYCRIPIQASGACQEAIP